jgi:hypothetical protein
MVKKEKKSYKELTDGEREAIRFQYLQRKAELLKELREINGQLETL